MSKRLVILSGDVNRTRIRDIINEMRKFDRESADPIQLFIYTPGGDLSAGLGLIEVMGELRSPVMTVAFGMCASAGAGILAAGTPGHRFVAPMVSFMTHQPRGSTTNEAGRIENMRDCKDLWAETLAKLSGNSVARMEELNDRDSYMTADQAVEHGFADQVLSHEPQ